MTRRPLPARRPSVTREVAHAGQRFTVTVGLWPDGRPGEVFADGYKSGTDQRHTLADACVWASLLLQHGVAPAELGRSLGRVPVVQATGDLPPPGAEAPPPPEAPASVLGVLAAVLAEVAAEVAEVGA